MGIKKYFLITLGLFFLVSTAAAQQPCGITIYGTVKDDSGNILSGVNVDLYLVGNKVASTTTSSDGKYVIEYTTNETQKGSYWKVRADDNGKKDEKTGNISYCPTVEKADLILSIIDKTPPSIIHSKVTSGLENTNLEINATITDSSGIKSATLYYRTKGATLWTLTTMNKTDSTYSAKIPADYVKLAGVEYYIMAVDYFNNTAYSPDTAPTTSYSITVYSSNIPPIADAGEDLTVVYGTKVILDASNSTDKDGNIVSYIWTENAAVLSTEKFFSKNDFEIGTHIITLKVTDNEGASATDIVIITVTPVPRKADAGPDITVYRDKDDIYKRALVTLDASKSTGDIKGYTWKENEIVISTSKTFSKKFSLGVHNITLIVTFDDGSTDTDYVVITVQPLPPVANAGNDITVISAPVTLDGSLSYGIDGSIEKYEWILDNIVIAKGIIVTHTFPVGIHTVTLNVTDSNGETASDDITITVISSPPVACVGNDVVVKNGESVTLSGECSKDNTKIVSYKWKDVLGNVLSESVNYTTAELPIGRNEIILEVEDEIGEIGKDKVIVYVNPDPPIANAGEDVTISLGQSVTLDGSFSYDEVGKVVAWKWTDMDGNVLSYDKKLVLDSMKFGIGIHEITLIVTDDTGEIGKDNVIVEVKSEPPVADAGKDVWVQVGTQVTLDASNSYDSNGTIVEYKWTENNYLLSKEKTFNNYYAEGKHIIVLTVTDNAGEKDIDTVVVNVTKESPPNQPPTAYAGLDKTTNVGDPVYFDASGSTDDQGIKSYLWDFGDGNTGNGKTTYHTYTTSGTYTVTLTVQDSEGLSSTDSLKVTVLQAKKSSTISLSVNLNKINLSESITLKGYLVPAHSAIVTLVFTSPSGNITYETVVSNSNGEYSLEFMPKEDGEWSVYSKWSGDSELYGSQSNTIKFEVVNPITLEAGYAIIIVGRNDDWLSQPYIDLTANNAYKVLLKRGFTNESIFYLNPSLQQEYPVDRISSIENISYSINTWAESRVSANIPLLIYLVNHGGNDKFFVKGTSEILEPKKLDEYLDKLTSITGIKDITVIYEACNSGSFIDELSENGRIIITSTSESANAGIDQNGAFFSKYFFNSISDAKTLKSAFESASNAEEIITYSEMLKNAGLYPQTPLLDDNGDGVGHPMPLEGTDDGLIANSKYLGPQVGALNLPPTITSYSEYSEPVNVNTEIEIWAKVIDDTKIKEVYASIIEPDYKIILNNDTLYEMNFTTLPLEEKEGKFTANFTPDKGGEYKILIHAIDEEGNIAMPKSLVINVLGKLKGDFNNNGRVDIGDATYVAYMVVGKVPVDLNADFNGNGRVDIGDATKIAFYVAGKIDKL